MRVVIRYSPNDPDYAPLCARVDGQGLWRALFRPDIHNAPSEWGGAIVHFPCAANRGFSRFTPLPIGGFGEAVSRVRRGFARIGRPVAPPLSL